MHKKCLTKIIIAILLIGICGYLLYLIINSYYGTNNDTNNNQMSDYNIDYSDKDKDNEDDNMIESIKIRVNNEVLDIKLENNLASRALVEKLKQGNITVKANEYGNFEKVGDLGFSLPTNDIRITTKPGDLMLYQGSQITLFYNSNSWSYTKLGEVVGKSQDELKSILGNDNVTLVISLE